MGSLLGREGTTHIVKSYGGDLSEVDSHSGVLSPPAMSFRKMRAVCVKERFLTLQKTECPEKVRVEYLCKNQKKPAGGRPPEVEGVNRCTSSP